MSEPTHGDVTDEARSGGREGSGGPTTGFAWTPDALAGVRRDPMRRRSLLVGAVVLGVAVTWLHWLGLFVAGALVGLVSRTVPRAVAAGVLLGATVLVVGVLASPAMGAGEFLALAPLSYVTILAALVAPAWGSLIRAVV